MLEFAQSITEKERHVKASYDLSQPQNRVWQQRYIGGKTESGETVSGGLKLEVEAGAHSPVYFSDRPISFTPQQGSWVFLGLDDDGRIHERRYEPDDPDADRSSTQFTAASAHEDIKIGKGWLYTFFSHRNFGRTTLLGYSDGLHVPDLLQIDDRSIEYIRYRKQTPSDVKKQLKEFMRLHDIYAGIKRNLKSAPK